MLSKQIIYVTGLPCSGATLVGQLLGHHPEIDSPVSSSPLCQALIGLRQHLSQDDCLSAQLDADFERTYARLMRSFRGFVDAWFAATEQSWVVDKHQDWLQHLEIVHQLDPNCRLLVCVRELGQIYASLEAQHQATTAIQPPTHQPLPKRFEVMLRQSFGWFYETFYPGQL
ncbi:MAG: sulfotransferase [Cyanobacteria bacterium J06559_3]